MMVRLTEIIHSLSGVAIRKITGSLLWCFNSLIFLVKLSEPPHSHGFKDILRQMYVRDISKI